MLLSPWIRRICPLLALLIAIFLPPGLEAQDKPGALRAIKVREPNGQILSYRYLGGSTDVTMRGTELAPDARIKLKIGSRPGFVELDINRGQITGLKPAAQFGADFLTYVLWAVSVDGKAANLGEITFEDDRPISINVTTPYQTFWLMLTAEPNYAVVDPSRIVVLYSVNEKEASDRTALSIPGELLFYTHYLNYDTKPASLAPVPNPLLQARKAVELAAKSGILASGGTNGARLEEERTREVMKQANAFLARAEAAYKENPNGADVAQFSRTAAQIAENARALAAGAVGGALVTQLAAEVDGLREELARLRMQPPSPPQIDALVEVESAYAAVGSTEETSSIEMNRPGFVVRMISAPLTWISAAGWGLALLLIFRRRSL